MTRRFGRSAALVVLLTFSSCTEATGVEGEGDQGWNFPEGDGSRDSGTRDADTVPDASTTPDASATPDANGPPDTSTCLARAPKVHRPADAMCDDERDPGNGGSAEFGDCTSDEDCTDGNNGRCGSDRDYAYCTYDECFVADDCGGKVCECEGGFRSDGNRCMGGNCLVNADCPTGFCSPTLGDCGHFDGTVAYFCRTCDDECIDDEDCQGGYCAYDEGRGHWACSTNECVG